MTPKLDTGPKLKEHPRNAYIRIMLYPEEKDAWFAQAQRYGLTMSTWMRYVLNNACANPAAITLSDNRAAGPELDK